MSGSHIPCLEPLPVPEALGGLQTGDVRQRCSLCRPQSAWLLEPKLDKLGRLGPHGGGSLREDEVGCVGGCFSDRISISFANNTVITWDSMFHPGAIFGSGPWLPSNSLPLSSERDSGESGLGSCVHSNLERG